MNRIYSRNRKKGREQGGKAEVCQMTKEVD